MTKTEVAAANKNALPAHLQGGKKTQIGNIDSTDLIIPRVKLLQAISPEIDDYENAKAGEFWHTVASESMGKELRGIPIILRKSYVLWSPRGDERGVLARANDGIHWDNKGMEFTVQPKNSPHPVTYKLGDTVHDSVDGSIPLSEFGSSVPGNPNSAPAAALTYQFLWYFPDAPELSPAIMINTRSSVKPAKALLSKIDLRPVDHYGQVFKIGIVKETGDDGPFYNYTYISDGYADEAEYEVAKAMYERFKESEWKANDESEDPDKESGPRKSSGGKADSDKF